MHTKKVVFILPDLGGGGAQRVMLNLARALDSDRFDLRLIAVGRADELAAEAPGRVVIERLNAARMRSALPRLVMSLRRIKPDIAVSTLGYINLGLLAVAPFIGGNTRIIVREANVVSATVESMPDFVPARWLYSRLYPRAAAVIAQTAEIADQIAAMAPHASIEILQNPVDEAALRQRAGNVTRVPGEGLRLVAAGRLTHQKGFDRLITLMPSLPADTRLTIFGEGTLRAALQSQIDALGLTARVTLPGFSRELPGAIAGADLLVLPSRWEGLPNVALEALALGTPVVASDEARIREVARHAAPGAVSIAPVGPTFADAIRARKPQPMASPRPSLLPELYRIETACATFNNILMRVARA